MSDRTERATKSDTPEGPMLPDLAQLSTASVANAIETFDVRNRNRGFVGGEIECRFADFGAMVGHALTVQVSSPDDPKPVPNRYWELWERLSAFPTPAVLVMQDVGENPSRCAYFGEVMATLAHRLGAVGLVTNGGVRDLSAVRRMGFHYFSQYVTPSHGNFRILNIGECVHIGGQEVEMGDLLHGDEDGVVVVPKEIAPDLPGAVVRVEQQERSLIEHIQGSAFSIEGAKRMRQEWH